MSYYTCSQIFRENNDEILAEDASEAEKAAQMDSIDKQMQELGTERVSKPAIDQLTRDLRGK